LEVLICRKHYFGFTLSKNKSYLQSFAAGAEVFATVPHTGVAQEVGQLHLVKTTFNLCKDDIHLGANITGLRVDVPV
jgi:hypothetical protein